MGQGCGLCSPPAATSFNEEELGQGNSSDPQKNGVQQKAATEAIPAAGSSAEEAEEMAKIKALANRGKRNSVSAEATSEDAIKNYKAPSYPKPDAAQKKIASTLKSNEKMQLLGIDRFSEVQLNEMVGAFQEKTIPKDQDVIRQGDNGDCLYIVDVGSFDIFVSRTEDDGSLAKPVKVATFGPGSLFGELALMYQAPRAATVRCTTADAKVWSLDRTPFQMLLKRCGVQAVEQYSGWLTGIDIFKVLNKHEISKIADACEECLFEEGENILSQGEDGDAFYILDEGKCAAFISTSSEPSGEKQVMTYDKQGNYFGELALLNNEPRKATVRALSDVTCVKIDKENFMNLLGPINDRLKARAGEYAKYASALK